jgi:hypothetical protein
MRRSARWALLCMVLSLWGSPGSARAEAQPGPGAWSSAALYNLANAYARAGQPGLAVLNYERAGLLTPGDPDIEANLLAVRRSAGLPAEPNGWSGARMIEDIDPTIASWIGLVGCLLIGASLLAGRMPLPRCPARRRRWARLAAAIAGCALIAVILINAAAVWPRAHEAIVVAHAAPVRVSPAPMGDTLFTLKEAEAVRIAGEHEGFVLVRASAGRTGWAWHTDLAPVVP